MPRSYKVTRHIGKQGYIELEAKWQQMADSAGSHFLHYPSWFKAYLFALEDSPESVVFFAFHRDDQLVAVIPLKHKVKYLDERFRIKLSYSAWELFYPSEMGVCDASLERDKVSKSLIKALTEELNNYIRWDAVETLYIPQQSSFYQLLCESSSFLTKPSHPSKYLETTADYDTCMSRFSKKFRKNLRRKLNNLEKQGQYHFEFITEKAALAGAFQNFLAVEGSGWKGDEGTSIAQQPNALNYYESLLDGYGKAGQAAIHLLWLNKKCIGAQFAVHAGSTLYLLKIGYDEAYAPLSPGFLLVDQLLKTACQREDINRISFVTGTQWMDVWKPSVETVYNGYYFNRTLTGLTLNIAMRLFERIKPFLNRNRDK